MTTPEDRVLERFLAKRQRRLAKGAEVRSLMWWSGKALEVPLSVVVGILLGLLLQRWVPAAAPWGFWGGLVTGIATAVRAAWRLKNAYAQDPG